MVVDVFNSINFKINGRPVQRSDVKCGTDIIWWSLILERWYALLQLSLIVQNFSYSVDCTGLIVLQSTAFMCPNHEGNAMLSEPWNV